MKNVALLLATRYLRGSSHETTVSTMVYICFLSIMIGSFSLTLVTAVMRGFEVTMYEKMQGIHASLIIRSHGQPIKVAALSRVIKEEFPEIIAFSPSVFGHAILQAQSDHVAPSVIILRGISPQQEAKVSTLQEKIISPPNATISRTTQGNKILIGKDLAKALSLTVGKEIKLLYTDSEKIKGRKITLQPVTAHIGGIFDTGIEDFDSSVAFCSLEFFETLLPHVNITQLHAALVKDADEQSVIMDLRKRTGLEVFSWKDLYPAIISALRLEKIVMFFILSLITLVASMNIIALLFMQIMRKRPDIAILKAIGARKRTITSIFMFMGISITTTASLVGISAAALASYCLEKYQFIKLPDAYYATHLPAHMSWYIALAVFSVVFCLGILSTWFPTRSIHMINISHILRYEG
jgi:lipoprotein-releasing system permease protein